MKNKLLVSVFAVALLAFSFTSCEQETDFDAIVDQISQETLKGYFSGTNADASDLVLHVVQYQFLESDTVLRTVFAIGDGVNQELVTTKFVSWSLGEFNTGGKGRYLTLYPEAAGAEPLVVNFINGGISEAGLPDATDHNNKAKDLFDAQEKMVGKHWYVNDTVWDRKDTTINVMKVDSIYKRTPKIDPETGEKVRDENGKIVYERTLTRIDTTYVPTKKKINTVPVKVNVRELELFRDPTTYVNTGVWHYVSKTNKVENHVVVKQEVDSVAEYSFHWSFESFASSAAFVIKAQQENGTQELFEIRYDNQVPAITLQQLVMKIKED